MSGRTFCFRGRSAVILLAFAPLLAAQSDSTAQDKLALDRGQQISSAVSSVTSTSMSPLLGVALYGAYKYARTPETARAPLPFYAKPHTWITLAVLLLLIFLKDTIGGAIPLLKKPLDALEVLVVNKASLVLLALPFMFDQVLPLVGLKGAGGLLSLYEPVTYADDYGAWHTASQVGFATLAILAGLVITFVVWLASHALDVLILLSPFPFIDVALKGLRTVIVLAIIVTSLIDKRAGLFVALCVVGVALLLFSWSVRLMIVGFVFSWDLIQLMIFRRHAKPQEVRDIVGFTAAKIHGIPRQAFSRITRDPNGILEVRYRRLDLGPIRRVRLENAAEYEIGRGILYPSIILPDRTGYRLQFRLPPRYIGREEQVQTQLGMTAVRDIRLRKGLRAFWRWVEGNTAAPARG